MFLATELIPVFGKEATTAFGAAAGAGLLAGAETGPPPCPPAGVTGVGVVGATGGATATAGALVQFKANSVATLFRLAASPLVALPLMVFPTTETVPLTADWLVALVTDTPFVHVMAIFFDVLFVQVLIEPGPVTDIAQESVAASATPVLKLTTVASAVMIVTNFFILLLLLNQCTYYFTHKLQNVNIIY